MQIYTQDYLRLVEKAGSICFLDIETNGLRGDYNSVLVVSIKPYRRKPISLAVRQVGHDIKVVREAKEILEGFDCWATYYGKGFDIPMLNTRLLRHGYPPIDKRHHIDMYYSLKQNILIARRSQGHLLSWLELPEQKMTVSANVWNQVAAAPEENLPILLKRCESDVIGLEALYERTKHVIRDIKR
jgi:uncharacterized protein YprB with RNaseH-like and TPR domain